MKSKNLSILFIGLSLLSLSSCCDNEEILVKEPTVSTISLTNVDVFTSTINAEITSDGGGVISEKGVCWSTQTNPTINDSKKLYTGGTSNSFTVDLVGLLPLTTYYVKAYAMNEKGVGYGNTLTFTTIDPLTAISTTAISNIDLTTASSGGTVSNIANFTITEKGVCWSTSPDPTINDSKLANSAGSGTFTSNISGLTENTTYYIRAYATNSSEVVYGNERTFKTLTTLTLQPGAEGKDGYYNDLNPAAIGGNTTGLCVMAWTNSGNPVLVRAVIDFDLSSIPANTTITSAYLSLYNDPTNLNNTGKHSEASVYPSTGGDNGAYLRRITSTWDESTICWNTQPTTTTTNQVLLAASTDAHQDYVGINVTTLIQDIINNKATSFGMMLILKTEVEYRGLIFGSSDNADVTNRPKLVVNY